MSRVVERGFEMGRPGLLSEGTMEIP